MDSSHFCADYSELKKEFAQQMGQFRSHLRLTPSQSELFRSYQGIEDTFKKLSDLHMGQPLNKPKRLFHFRFLDLKTQYQWLKLEFFRKIKSHDAILSQEKKVKTESKAKKMWKKIHDLTCTVFKGVNRKKGVLPIAPEYYLEIFTSSLGEHYRPERLDAWQMDSLSSSFSDFEDSITNNPMRVHYFSLEKLQSKRVTFTAGRHIFQGGLVPQNGHDYAFILDAQGSMYMTIKSEIIDGRRLNHTSLSLGKPVQGAGFATVREGQLVEVQFLSGHYKSEEKQVLNVMGYLRDKCGEKETRKILFVDHEGRVIPETVVF